MRSIAVFAGLTVIVMLAAVLRLPDLDNRVLHGDEANQAFKTGVLLEEGRYEYDPREHHGPTLYYLALIPAQLRGQDALEELDIVSLRALTALCGVTLVAFLALAADGLGRWGTLWAGLLTALSPAFVYYSRYYIQETLFVLFCFLMIAAGWRYIRRPALSWAIVAGAAAGLAFSTKETCVLAFFSMAVALPAAWFWHRWRSGEEVRPEAKRSHLLGGIAAGLVVSVLFFSSFFTHPQGVLDSVRTFWYYIERSGGAGLHAHPWHFYLSRLIYAKPGVGAWWSEALIVGLALVGGVWALATPRGNLFVRFLPFYTVALTALYSALPYKTPWTMLGFLHGMVLLAGVGAAVLVKAARWRPSQAVVAVLLLAGAAHLGWQAYRAAFVYPAAPRNPYVYAHTSSAFLRLVERIRDLDDVYPPREDMPVYVIDPIGDYWPLPWYLRDMDNVGFWNKAPDRLHGVPVIVTDKMGLPQLDEDEGYTWEMHGLRPGKLLRVYIDKQLWERFIERRR